MLSIRFSPGSKRKALILFGGPMVRNGVLGLRWTTTPGSKRSPVSRMAASELRSEDLLIDYVTTQGMCVRVCEGKSSSTAGLHYATEYPIRSRFKKKASATFCWRNGSQGRAWASLAASCPKKLTWFKHGCVSDLRTYLSTVWGYVCWFACARTPPRPAYTMC